jgi:ATP-dependent helicase/nuclease subunit A
MSSRGNKKTLSEDQIRERIITDRRNMFVEAGAGAGKTHLLSNRIVHQIASGEPIDSFVVITFTNAAAAELGSRIQRMLAEKERNTEDSTIKEALHNALLHIDEMQISTM